MPGLPDRLFAQASPHSEGGVSLFEAEVIDQETVANFTSPSQLIEEAVVRLGQSGFEVLQVTPTTINIAASPELFEEAFETRLEPEERPVIKEGGREDTATFVECPDTELQGLIATRDTRFGDVLEGVAIEEPVYYHQSATPPKPGYWHLEVPHDVAAMLNADSVHAEGVTGQGVRVVMVDSGWYAHPYFAQQGYRPARVVLAPASEHPADDESGHGTGESANVFAAAPDIDFTMVKNTSTNSTAGFNTAVTLGPDVLSCSWGSSRQTGPLSAIDQALAAAVATAVANGIVVVFSAGNGHWGFPGQHPDVISAGGVYVEADGSMRASDYSSGFASQIYPGRQVPDLSGLVGMLPRAAYIMLPVQPGAAMDRKNAGGTHPNGDETAENDGWAAFSGTSAAAPQLAGICALIKQVCPHLQQTEIRDILMRSARDVTVGSNHPLFNEPAGPGYDLATGAGLADADRAVQLAKEECGAT
jgi:Subtilase family